MKFIQYDCPLSFFLFSFFSLYCCLFAFSFLTGTTNNCLGRIYHVFSLPSSFSLALSLFSVSFCFFSSLLEVLVGVCTLH